MDFIGLYGIIWDYVGLCRKQLLSECFYQGGISIRSGEVNCNNEAQLHPTLEYKMMQHFQVKREKIKVKNENQK